MLSSKQQEAQMQAQAWSVLGWGMLRNLIRALERRDGRAGSLSLSRSPAAEGSVLLTWLLSFSCQPFKGDNYCDASNNRAFCNYDGGDCCTSTVKTKKVSGRHLLAAGTPSVGLARGSLPGKSRRRRVFFLRQWRMGQKQGLTV